MSTDQDADVQVLDLIVRGWCGLGATYGDPRRLKRGLRGTITKPIGLFPFNWLHRSTTYIVNISEMAARLTNALRASRSIMRPARPFSTSMRRCDQYLEADKEVRVASLRSDSPVVSLG